MTAAATADLQLTWDQVLAWRLAQQGLGAATVPSDPVDLVGHLAGVQTQVEASARQVLAVRGAGAVDVDALLWSDRRLLKTWAMRGTLHLLPAAEWRTWIAVMRTREWRITPGWERYHGITKAELDAVTAAIPEALAGDPLTRDELAERVAAITGHDHLGDVLRSGWAQVFKPAANRGLLCQGPPRGKATTFTSPATWLDGTGQADDPDPREAAAAVLARFLDVSGPATREDIARWLGVTPKEARVLLAEHGGDLVEVDVEGARGWMTPSGASAAGEAGTPEGVRLLPGFDPWVLAPLSHRAHTIPDGHVDDVSRTAGWISPVLLVDGRVAGTWEPATDGRTTVVTVTPFARLPRRVVTAARDHLATAWAPVLGRDLRLDVAA
jgi:winged helix DNA-binding protein